MEHEAPPWPVPSGTASTSKHAATPETSSPSSPGSQPGLGFAGEPGPLGRWPALGGDKARSRPVVDQEHLAIDGQRNARAAVAVTPPQRASPPNWPTQLTEHSSLTR